MKVTAKVPLFQFGINAYKGQEVEVDAATAKRLAEGGFILETEQPKKQTKRKSGK